MVSYGAREVGIGAEDLVGIPIARARNSSRSRTVDQRVYHGGMRLRPLAVGLLALATTACAGDAPRSVEVPTASATSVSREPASPTPSAEPQTSPTPAPTATAAPTSEPPQAAFGADVFAEPDECTNTEDGFRVAYPNAWYSNAAVPNPLDPNQPGIPACRYFAPVAFGVTYGSEPVPDIAILIAANELPPGAAWTYAPVEGRRLLSDATVHIDGLPARVLEYEVTVGYGPIRPGDRNTTYVVELGDNRFLVAQTTNQKDYDAARPVLADMMRTLDILAP